MTVDELLKKLFPQGIDSKTENSIIKGMGKCSAGEICFLGTSETVYIGLEEIIALGRGMLDIIREHPNKPILMLVNNNGQRMALREELLALPEYIGHLISIQHLARLQMHKLLSLVYGNSIAGGFLAFGMAGPSRIYALADAHTSVMNLPAISAVTKLSLKKLEEMSKTVPVFAPGCDNFHKMGGLHGIIPIDTDMEKWLAQALEEYADDDNRAALGAERSGRKEANGIINAIINA